MQAFKIYGKVMVKNLLGTLIMYICIFLGVAVLQIKLSSNSNTTTTFNQTKSSVAVINNDDSELSLNFQKFIHQNTKKVEIGTSDEEIKDAVFHGAVSYVIIIPDGFGESFCTENEMKLKTYQYPNSTSGTYIEMMTDSYLSYAKMYFEGTGKIDFEKLTSIMNNKAEVEFTKKEETQKSYSPVQFFNYMAYPLLALLLYAIPTSFRIFNKTDLKRRNLCSPVNPNFFSLQLVLGSLITTFIIFAIFIITAIILDSELVLSKTGVLLILNTLIFTVVSMSIGFFVSNITKSTQAITAISNVISLGVAFTGGIFVPQSFMRDGVKKASVINPGYWYVKCNEEIASITNLTFENLKASFGYMLIQLIFAAAFISVALVASKLNRQSDN